jgi:formylglycine-generating enzyme required for sulfatase activity
MRKISIIVALIFFICAIIPFSLPSREQSRERGIKVTTKSPDGTTKQAQLYSGYYALVAGCGDYRRGWPKLPNPVKDARKVSRMLERMGWKVETLENPDGKTLRKKFTEIIEGPGKSKDTGILFWFSGHGHTREEADGTKLGYLVPVDAPDPYQDLFDFYERAVSMRRIETFAKQIKSKHVLMIFDSCFSGAIFQMVRAKPSPYIQEKVTYPVRQFITAGTEDEQVPDRSVFREVFIQGIEDGFADRNDDSFVTGEETGSYLQEKVVNYSRNAQHPQYGKINNPRLDKGDFVIALKQEPAPGDTTINYSDIIRLRAMKAQFDELKEHDRSSFLTVDEKIKMWKDFLSTFSRDNPIGAEDDMMRRKARERREFWAEYEEPARRIPEHRIEEPFTNSIGMTFVYIPPGSFTMGSPSSEPERDDDERQHHVTLTKGFFMQTTEVTQGQWKAVMGSNPSYFKNCGDNCPVEKVSWEDVQEFIRKLNRKEGVDRYRLPTEAEWEYACRAGTTTPFNGGNCLSADEANYDGNYPLDGCPKGSYREKTVPVGSFPPNDWGLYDMHGNVWEWCSDWYGEYPSGSVTDPEGPSSGSYRVFRGGSWLSYARGCRSASRFLSAPGCRRDLIGFRLARTL